MKAFAYIIGAIFLMIGIAGFIPPFVVEEHLISIFHVNMGLNILHIVSGVLAIMATFSIRIVLKIYFQIFGVLYALLSIFGFMYGEQDIFDVLASNSPDTWFHVIISITCLILGYGSKD